MIRLRPPVFARLMLLVGLLLALAGPRAAEAEVPAIAVLDLSNDTGQHDLDGAGAGVAGLLVAKLARTDTVRVVERQQISALLAEIALGASGAVDPATAAKAGKLVGADYVVLGSLFSVKLPAVAITVRIVDAQDGTVVVAEEVTGSVGEKGDSFFLLVDDLAWRVLDALQIRLSGADRIEFGQVDARRLETVSVYGEALRAIDAEQPDVAERLLGRAVTLEPDFALASKALAALAAEVGERRSTYAHEAVQDYRAWLDALDAATRVEAPVADERTMEALAIRARLHLIRGELDDFHAVEAQRLALWPAFEEKVALRPGEMRIGTLEDSFRHSVEEDFLHLSGADAPGVRAFSDLPLWPWQIRVGIAEVQLLSGQRDQALATIVDTYRHPGPNEPSHARSTPPSAPHPLQWALEHGLLEDAVPLLEQQLRLAEKADDQDGAQAKVRELDDLLGKVAERQAAAARYRDRLALRPGKKHERATPEDVVEESAALAVPLAQVELAVVSYRAFQARLEAGYYDDVRREAAFARLADGWRGVMDTHFSAPCYLERRLGHLLAYQEAVRTGDPAADARLDAALRAFVEEGYR